MFRLLLLKRLLEQKQVADMAMIPSKEAKELLYTLLAENYITLQVRRGRGGEGEGGRRGRRKGDERKRRGVACYREGYHTLLQV